MEFSEGPQRGLQHSDTEEQALSGRHWLGWLRWTIPTGAGFESTRNLAKWLFLSTAIGIVAGLGAIVFYLAIQVATAGFLGRIVGYLPPGPIGEGSSQVLPMARPWLLPLVTTIGGLISGLIVFTLAPEAEGHGTDAAISAIHHHGSRIRARIPPIKLIASAITIGSGGSGGREGPAAQISAGFGSLMGEWLRLDARDRRIAVAAGIGAGIGAIFRAPLGGALLAAEILYLHDLEVEAIIPALIAGIVGYTLYGTYFGFGPIFGSHPGLSLGSPIQLFYYAVLGLLSGLGGIAYARSFYGVGDAFHRLALPNWFKPALGGLIVGLLGLVLPQALHMGYGWVQLAMTGNTLFQIPLWVVLVLPLAKILATSLSIGSGGSGGIFGPGMVIGGMLGAAFWRLTHGILPHMPAQPAPFVIIGMMALFGGIAHAPLAVMLMVAEMTGNLSLLAPAMVAVAISTALIGDHTIYQSQLRDRASAPFHKVRLSFPMLSALLVRDAMTEPQATVQVGALLTDAEAQVGEDRSGLVVVNEAGEFAGIISREAIQRVPLEKRRQLRARDVLVHEKVALAPDEPLDHALERLTERGMSWAPVVERGRVLGQLTVRDIVRAYKSMLRRGIRRTSSLPPHTSLFEVLVGPGSPLAGRTLREANLPRDTLVISITRNGETIFPRASTQIKAGDVVMIMADPRSEPALRAYFSSSGPRDASL